jgi:hypothetical protein
MFALIFLLSSIPDGSIIFVENGSDIVKNITNSYLTHVAIVFNEYVYESNHPKVKKTPVEKYLKINKNIIILSSKVPYSNKEVKNMQRFAESQIGKKYSVKAYIRGIPAEGMHCSEYISEILIKSGRYQSSVPSRVTPGSLWKSIKNDYEEKAR